MPWYHRMLLSCLLSAWRHLWMDLSVVFFRFRFYLFNSNELHLSKYYQSEWHFILQYCGLYTINGLRMRRSLAKLSGWMKSVTKIVTGCLRTTTVGILALCDWKGNLVIYENMGLCLCMYLILITLTLTWLA